MESNPCPPLAESASSLYGEYAILLSTTLVGLGGVEPPTFSLSEKRSTTELKAPICLCSKTTKKRPTLELITPSVEYFNILSLTTQ